MQALAIEGARDNVDAHYSYISRTRDEFARAHAAQTASHEELLASFESDMDALRATPLHPAVVAASERRRAAAAAATRDARRRAKRPRSRRRVGLGKFLGRTLGIGRVHAEGRGTSTGTWHGTSTGRKRGRRWTRRGGRRFRDDGFRDDGSLIRVFSRGVFRVFRVFVILSPLDGGETSAPSTDSSGLRARG